MPSNFDVDNLILLVQERPVLWDKTLETYKMKVPTEDAWNEIFGLLNREYEDTMTEKEKCLFGKSVVNRWTNVRDSYMKWKRREREIKKSKSGAFSRKKYIYAPRLLFLNKVADLNNTVRSHEDSFSHDNNNPSTAAFTKLGVQRRKNLDEVEWRILEALENNNKPPNPHLLFFQSLLPTIEKLSPEQTLCFQKDVIDSLQKITQPVTQRPDLSRFPFLAFHPAASMLYTPQLYQPYLPPFPGGLLQPPLIQIPNISPQCPSSSTTNSTNEDDIEN